jgi:Na+/proline symporter
MTATAASISWFLMFMQDYGTDQITVQRLLAVKDLKAMAKSAIFNSFTDLIIVSLLLFIGLGLFAYYTAFPLQNNPDLTADKMLPFYIITVLPPVASGLLISAIFAAAMSSMDSGINSVTTVIVSDIIKPLRRTQHTEKHDVNLARIITVVLGIISTVAAIYASSLEHIVKAWSTILGLFAGPILAIFLLGILTRHGNFLGWITGIIFAAPATYCIQNYTEVHWVYYFPFSFLITFIIAFLASFLFPSKKPDPSLTIWPYKKPIT